MRTSLKKTQLNMNIHLLPCQGLEFLAVHDGSPWPPNKDANSPSGTEMRYLFKDMLGIGHAVLCGTGTQGSGPWPTDSLPQSAPSCNYLG